MSTVSQETYTYDGYVDVVPSVAVDVRVVRLEYDIVVVHRGKEIVVVLDSGIGGQMRVCPGRAVTCGVAEFQILGLIYTISSDESLPDDDDPSSDCKSTAQSANPRKERSS